MLLSEFRHNFIQQGKKLPYPNSVPIFFGRFRHSWLQQPTRNHPSADFHLHLQQGLPQNHCHCPVWAHRTRASARTRGHDVPHHLWSSHCFKGVACKTGDVKAQPVPTQITHVTDSMSKGNQYIAFRNVRGNMRPHPIWNLHEDFPHPNISYRGLINLMNLPHLNICISWLPTGVQGFINYRSCNFSGHFPPKMVAVRHLSWLEPCFPWKADHVILCIVKQKEVLSLFGCVHSADQTQIGCCCCHLGRF